MKKLGLFFLFSFLLFSVGDSLHAEELNQKFFTRIDVRDGLSENNVKAILQDSLGFMWFGTKNGLNRYDGNMIKRYDVDDAEKGCSNHNISALFEDGRHRLWVGTDKGVYVFNPYSETFSFFDVKTEKGIGITDWISQIVGDHSGNIWIISPNEGAFRYNEATGKMSVYRRENEKPSYKNNPQSICVMRDGEVWIGTNGAGLMRYNQKKDDFTYVKEDAAGFSLEGKNIFTVCDYGGKIAVGEHEDRLLSFDPRTGLFSEIYQEVNYKVIRCLLYDGRELFVGTQDGLFILGDDGRRTCVKENSLQPYGLSDNIIYSIYQDRDNGIWLGTGFCGVNYMPQRGIVFRNHVPMYTANSLSNRYIREMAFDAKGRLWIASEEGALNIYAPRTQTFTSVPLPEYNGGKNRLALMAHGDSMWSGLFKNGLDIIDINTLKVTHFTPDELGLREEGSVYALFKDREGRVWLGSGNGLYLKLEGMRFMSISVLPSIFVQDIAQDKNGDIWIATMGNGAYRYSPKMNRYINYSWKPSGNSISSNSISSITITDDDNIWFSTDRGGICKYDIDTDTFTSYSKGEGLPDDMAYKILSDDWGNLWFGTNQGLVRFEEDTHNVSVFRNTNGLIGNQYNYKSAVKTPGGEFFFGGADGVVAFNPPSVPALKTGRKVFITNVFVDDKEIKPSESNILSNNILYADKIKLPYDMYKISIDVSSLNFSRVESDCYEYMLSGVDNTWIKTTDGRGISYSHLQPGSYTLHVRLQGDSSDGTALSVLVASPWYSSLPARIAYLLLFVLACVVAYRRWHDRQMREFALREQHYKEEKDKELLRLKINFFTDVTHEIRTPLTLINGSMENIAEEKIDSPLVRKNLSAVAKNCRRLLNLVNQLLDFNKVNTNIMTLHYANTDICYMLREITDRFEPGVARLGKTISLDLEEDSIIATIDPEAVTKIMSNLLNNARKYSETFINVHARRNGNEVEIAVINDGKKIPADKAEKIFEPFVQLDSANTMGGSGIGLPLARKLAELHSGSLVVDVKTDYNCFVVRLPLENDATATTESFNPGSYSRGGGAGAEVPDKQIIDDSADHIQQPADEENARVKENTVLVVEDNAELREMITDKLKTRYNILTAANGKEGLDVLKSSHVDIVVSDIVMPVMDGLQMTQELKEDVEVNHIPIILLTAKSDIDNRIDGLKAGADAYISKPFRFSHLLQQIETLLENRRRERESFLRKPYLPVQNSSTNKQEEEFLRKMSDIITKNISQPEFNVEQLAQEMCMSRSSLHRKIKEVSNLTPIDFIRLIRLKKAAELIKEHNYRTSEVCEMVGISSPSYFIKLFQKQFGMTPKEFAQKE